MLFSLLALPAFGGPASIVVYDTTPGTVLSFTPLYAPGPSCPSVCLGGPAGFSFTSPNSATNVADVQIKLNFNSDASRSGTITVALYSNTSGPAPGSLIATLGTLAESSVTNGDNIYDFPVANGPALTPNTRYWVVVSDSNGSTAVSWAGQVGTGGTGVSGEYLGLNFFSQYAITFANNSAPPLIASVTVLPSISPTPAPSSLIAALIGLAFLAFYASRQRFART